MRNSFKYRLLPVGLAIRILKLRAGQIVLCNAARLLFGKKKKPGKISLRVNRVLTLTGCKIEMYRDIFEEIKSGLENGGNLYRSDLFYREKKSSIDRVGNCGH